MGKILYAPDDHLLTQKVRGLLTAADMWRKDPIEDGPVEAMHRAWKNTSKAKGRIREKPGSPPFDGDATREEFEELLGRTYDEDLLVILIEGFTCEVRAYVLAGSAQEALDLMTVHEVIES